MEMYIYIPCNKIVVNSTVPFINTNIEILEYTKLGYYIDILWIRKTVHFKKITLNL